MRVMGLDVGDKTIGVAVSDPLGITAQGIKTIYREDMDKDFKELQWIIDEYDIEKIVVGLPINMNGSMGPRGQKTLDFIEKLKKGLDLPVEHWDERLSTVSAERTLLEGDMSRRKRKKVIDKLAAVFILQNYLDFVSGS